MRFALSVLLVERAFAPISTWTKDLTVSHGRACSRTPELRPCLMSSASTFPMVSLQPENERQLYQAGRTNASTSFVECRSNTVASRDSDTRDEIVPIVSANLAEPGYIRRVDYANATLPSSSTDRPFQVDIHPDLGPDPTRRSTSSLASGVEAHVGDEGPAASPRNAESLDGPNRRTSVASSTPTAHMVHCHIGLMTPMTLSRYERHVNIPPQEIITKIPPMTTVWPHSKKGGCGNWIPVTHPEGSLYFYDAERHIFTENYMYDKAWRTDVERLISYLGTLIKRQDKELPPNHDLVVEVEVTDDGNMYWFYYYVDHDTRSVFWLKETTTKHLEAYDITSLAHLKHTIEFEYWTHWSYFPVGPSPFPKAVREELLAILIQNAVEYMILPGFATSPWKLEPLMKMVSLVKECDVNSPANGPVVCALAQLLSSFSHWRFVNVHGQREARLARSRNVHKQPPRRTALIRLLSPFLFWAPELELSDIERLWVEEDKNLDHSQWKGFMSNLQSEWSGFVAYASILLAANVAFLAIPGVVQDTTSASKSPAQVTSDLSVAFSLGSIILGLLLLRSYRGKDDALAGAASVFMFKRSRSVVGFEPMVIIHSFPFAMLMWAMITFLVAFLLFCFQETGLSTRIPVGMVSIVILCSVVWCVPAERKTREKTIPRSSKGTMSTVRKYRAKLYSALLEVLRCLDGSRASVFAFCGRVRDGGDPVETV